MKTLRIALFLGVFAAAALPLRAQDALSRDPGYVDFAVVEQWFDREARVEVNVKGALLKLVAEASEYEDPELARMLRKITAIQVRGYALDAGSFASIERQTSALARRLEGMGWETVARVREDDERVDVFIKMRGDVIAGLTVLVVSPGDDDTVFVNIVGDIDPEQIGRIGRKFNIGRLQDGVVDKH